MRSLTARHLRCWSLDANYTIAHWGTLSICNIVDEDDKTVGAVTDGGCDEDCRKDKDDEGDDDDDNGNGNETCIGE